MTMRPDYERAAIMANRCLVRMMDPALPVRPMTMLHRCRNVRVLDLQEAAEAAGLPREELERTFARTDAVTLRRDGPNGETAFLVCYRSDGNRARLNFTLAHELAHVVLGHRSSEPWEEQEADWFASHLLCPQPVWQAVAPMPADRAAALFYVSTQAARKLGARRAARLPEELEQQVTALYDAAIRKERGENA